MQRFSRRSCPLLVARTLYSGNPGFFHQQEIDKLTKRLEGSPSFTVMLGPISSGKTALVRHVLGQKKTGGDSPLFHSIPIDLRGVSVSTPGAFVWAFLKQISLAKSQDTAWARAFRDLEIERQGVKVKSTTRPSSELGLVKDFGEILDSIAACIPQWTCSHGERPRVLVIDEANELDQLARVSEETFRDFINFCVRVTREEAKLHVIFTSSQSFFDRWLVRLSSADFDNLVLGDLPRDEAYKYYLKLISMIADKKVQQPFDKSEEHFEKNVFHLTGGRLFLIREYVEQVYSDGPSRAASDFGPVELSQIYLEQDLLGSGRVYSGQEAMEVFKELVESPGGYISYEKLREKYGDTKISKMTARNMLHHRPVCGFSQDLDPAPTEEVLTPSTQAALRAMEVLLDR